MEKNGKDLIKEIGHNLKVKKERSRSEGLTVFLDYKTCKSAIEVKGK